MNYRHAFHAGNPADVIKHAVLAFILAHMTQKETPLRVVDTHAGIGVYDLTSDAAAIRIRTAGIEGLVNSLRPKP